MFILQIFTFVISVCSYSVSYDVHISFQGISNIVEVLDPEGDGKIHFREFCQGVRQIMELNSELLMVTVIVHSSQVK